jgi:uncharacterized phiE125 gp8 family phage protein
MPGFISLADAKRHLKVETDDEDAYIAALIAAAGAFIEDRTGFVCPRREEERFGFDGFCRKIELLRRPIDPATVSVSYLDGSGETQTLAEVRLVEKNGTTRILPPIGRTFPTPARTEGAVSVLASVGYPAATDEAEVACSDSLKHAARLLVGHFYRNREAVVTGTTSSDLQFAVDSLLDADRLRKL